MNSQDIDIIATLGREAREYLEASAQHPHNSKLSNVLYDAAMRCISEIHRTFDNTSDAPRTLTNRDIEHLSSTYSLLNSMILAGEKHTFSSNKKYIEARRILSDFCPTPPFPSDNYKPFDTFRIAGINYRIDENGHVRFEDYYNGETVEENATVPDGSEHNKYTGSQATSLFVDDLYEFEEMLERQRD